MKRTGGFVSGVLDVLVGRLATFVAAGTLTVALVDMVVLMKIRYVLSDSIIRSEEVERYALVWSSMIGAAAAYRQGAHVAVTDVVDWLPPAAQVIVARIVHLLILAFSVMFTWQSWTLALRSFGRHELTAALQIDIAWVQLAFPVAGALMSIIALEALWRGPQLSSGVSSV